MQRKSRNSRRPDISRASSRATADNPVNGVLLEVYAIQRNPDMESVMVGQIIKPQAGLAKPDGRPISERAIPVNLNTEVDPAVITVVKDVSSEVKGIQTRDVSLLSSTASAVGAMVTVATSETGKRAVVVGGSKPVAQLATAIRDDRNTRIQLIGVSSTPTGDVFVYAVGPHIVMSYSPLSTAYEVSPGVIREGALVAHPDDLPVLTASVMEMTK